MAESSPETVLSEAREIVRAGADLPAPLIPAAAEALLSERAGDDARISFLTALAEKGETPREVAGFAQAYLPHAVDPGCAGCFADQALMDCCGTGGGGVDLANVSTAIMFVMAAAGVPVVKHGNKGLTKKSGSADVLTALGVRIDLTPEQSMTMLEEVGCCFFMAPRYHPAFKAVAGARQSLGARGQRTVFNFLGPLLNPARPDAQMVGLFRLEGLDFYTECLKAMGRKRFLLVYGESETGQAMGEASVIGNTHLQGILDGMSVREVIPAQVQGTLNELLVASADESAKRIESALNGEPSEELLIRMLIFNAGLGIWTQGAAAQAQEGIELAGQVMRDGRAGQVLRQAREFSARLSSGS
jgi:anthranilate phosphoribosyltransferase